MRLVLVALIMLLVAGSAHGIGITKTMDFSVPATQGITYIVGNASANQTATLLDAATSGLKGLPFTFVVSTDPGSYYFRLTATGADHIGGNDYYVITEPGSISVVSDGSVYHVLYHEGTWAAVAA